MSEIWSVSFSERKNGIMKRWPQKDTSRALHFGKHCSRMKANETRWWRFLPRSEEQLDTREPSRLQSSLYRILRKREKTGGWRRDRTKTKERARWARESVHNGEPEIRADAPWGASLATRRGKILSSWQLYDARKGNDKERGGRGEGERNNLSMV